MNGSVFRFVHIIFLVAVMLQAGAAPIGYDRRYLASEDPVLLKRQSSEDESSIASRSPNGTYYGNATYYYQNGVTGACGAVSSDSDYVAAITSEWYGSPDFSTESWACWKQITIRNVDENSSGYNNTVNVTIADGCPTCETPNSVDLSVAAFQQIADLSEGIVDMEWHFLD